MSKNALGTSTVTTFKNYQPLRQLAVVLDILLFFPTTPWNEPSMMRTNRSFDSWKLTMEFLRFCCQRGGGNNKSGVGELCARCCKWKNSYSSIKFLRYFTLIP